MDSGAESLVDRPAPSEPGRVDGTFEAEAAQVLDRLRGAFRDLVQALPKKVTRASELEKALNIDRTLAWKVHRLITEPDRFPAAKHAPKPAALEVFLKAATRAKTPQSLIEGVRAAAGEFEQLAQTHADDRHTLETMLDGCTPASDRKMLLTHKRAAYRANRHLWGLQSRVQLGVCIAQPSATAGKLDAVWLRGHLDLRWLRAGAPWVVAEHRMSDADNKVRSPVVRERLDDRAGDPGAVPLLTDFCSEPLPRFRRVDLGPGMVRDELIPSGLGSTRAVSYVTGELVRGVGERARDEHNPIGRIGARVELPTAILLLELLVRDDTFGPLRPESIVYRGGQAADGAPYGSADRLHLGETVSYLGKWPSRSPGSDLPRYTEMCNYVFDKLGWEASRFDVYRCQVAYPVIPSTSYIQFDLPERPYAGV